MFDNLERRIILLNVFACMQMCVSLCVFIKLSLQFSPQPPFNMGWKEKKYMLIKRCTSHLKKVVSKLELASSHQMNSASVT